MNFDKLLERPKMLVAAAVGALLVLAIGCGLVVWVGSSILSPSTWALVSFPNRAGEADLYLVRMGDDPRAKGTLLVEDAGEHLTAFVDEEQVIVGPYGGFLTPKGDLLFWYQDPDKGKVYLATTRPKQDEPVVIFDTRHAVYGRLLPDERFFILESNDTQRCYVAAFNQEAERRGKADWCWLSGDGSTILLVNQSHKGADVQVVDRDDGTATTLLEDAEDITTCRIAGNGAQVACQRAAEDGDQLVVLDARRGTTLFESEVYPHLVDFGFASQGDALAYIAEDDEGTLHLMLLRGDQAQEVAQATALAVFFDASGAHLLYIASDDAGQETVYTYPTKGGSPREIVSGQEEDDLRAMLLPDHKHLLVLQQTPDEVVLYTAALDGGDVTPIFQDDEMGIEEIHFDPAHERFFLLVRTADGTLSLLTTRVGQKEWQPLVEDWDTINLLNRSPKDDAVLFSGREAPGDDLVLYRVAIGRDGATPQELDDDAEGFVNAVFSANGKQVFYTALTGYDADEVEVRVVPADGKKPYEVVYEEAVLEDVSWAPIAPFDTDTLSDWQAPQVGSAFCPGAPALALDTPVEGDIPAGESRCYRFRASADDIYTFAVSGPLDTYLTLYDREGTFIASDDDSGPDYNPRLRVRLKPGVYFVELENIDAQAGTYTLQVNEGVNDPAFTQAQPLTPGQPTRGAITESTEIYLADYDLSTYGVMYTFQGHAGDTIVVDVRADSIGSELDPYVYLFGPDLSFVASDDDSGEGYDARLTYTLDQDGPYYVLVTSVDGSYGYEERYFYEILLTIQR